MIIWVTKVAVWKQRDLRIPRVGLGLVKGSWTFLPNQPCEFQRAFQFQFSSCVRVWFEELAFPKLVSVVLLFRFCWFGCELWSRFRFRFRCLFVKLPYFILIQLSLRLNSPLVPWSIPTIAPGAGCRWIYWCFTQHFCAEIVQNWTRQQHI